MKKIPLAIIFGFLSANQVNAEKIYFLSSVYINQSDLARYEKKWYSNTSISSEGTFYFKDMESCRSALKDKLLIDTADPTLDIASNKVSAEYPEYTLTYNNGGAFYHNECVIAFRVQ